MFTPPEGLPAVTAIRAFIAIELDDALRRELARIQSVLRASEADVKWVEAGNIHLTLKFLGDTPPNQIDTVKAVLDETSAAFSSFDIEISELGAFPSIRNPRIIWAGVGRNADTLATIARSLENSLEPLGFMREDRPFAAHITLGRVRSPHRRERLTEALQAAMISGGLSQKVTKLTLFQSRLTPQGPAYSMLGEGRLA